MTIAMRCVKESSPSIRDRRAPLRSSAGRARSSHALRAARSGEVWRRYAASGSTGLRIAVRSEAHNFASLRDASVWTSSRTAPARGCARYRAGARIRCSTRRAPDARSRSGPRSRPCRRRGTRAPSRDHDRRMGEMMDREAAHDDLELAVAERQTTSTSAELEARRWRFRAHRASAGDRQRRHGQIDSDHFAAHLRERHRDVAGSARDFEHARARRSDRQAG